MSLTHFLLGWQLKPLYCRSNSCTTQSCFCLTVSFSSHKNPQRFGPEAEEMSLWASVSLAVGWRGGQFLEVTPSPEALPYAPCVLGFCLMLLIDLWVWTVKSCHFVVKVISPVPAACTPSCSLSVSMARCALPSACSSCCEPLASQLWWQHLGLGLKLLLEVLSCCLNCTSVSNSQHLLIPELGFAKCQIPLKN